MVDRTALKTNQAVIMAVCVIAALARWPALVGIGALLLALGAVVPRASPVLSVYLRWLRPSGLLQPQLVAEAAAPHRFAQATGAACLGAGWVLLALGMPVLGWGLVWLVALLAAANLAGGFCVGCQIYGLLAESRDSRRRVSQAFPPLRPRRIGPPPDGLGHSRSHGRHCLTVSE